MTLRIPANERLDDAENLGRQDIMAQILASLCHGSASQERPAPAETTGNVNIQISTLFSSPPQFAFALAAEKIIFAHPDLDQPAQYVAAQNIANASGGVLRIESLLKTIGDVAIGERKLSRHLDFVEFEEPEFKPATLQEFGGDFTIKRATLRYCETARFVSTRPPHPMQFE